MTQELEVLERVDGHTGELVPISPGTLFGTNDPDGVIAGASLAARSLAKVVKRQNLTSKIQGKDYVRVEGWTLLGSMLGVFPCVTEMHKLATEGGGWEAYVEARTRFGEIVGGAWAQCTRSEKSWANRDDYALRSMAQTRATSKALRMPLGFVMALAGFEATPAEEIPAEQSDNRAALPEREPGAKPADSPGSAGPEPSRSESAAVEKRTTAQNRKIHAIIGELDAGFPPPAPYADWRSHTVAAVAEAKNKDLKELSKAEAGQLIDAMETRLAILQSEASPSPPNAEVSSDGGEASAPPAEEQQFPIPETARSEP